LSCGHLPLYGEKAMRDDEHEKVIITIITQILLLKQAGWFSP
jgi:hypothetical protein